MRFLNTKWGKYNLSWFWSDKYWYVTATNKRYKKTGRPQKWPIGSGKTQDDAFNEFRLLLDA